MDDAKFLPDVMPRALNVAQTGRPGAVLIDVPMDVFSQQIERPRPGHAAPPARATAGRPAPDDGIAEAAELLLAARSAR